MRRIIAIAGTVLALCIAPVIAVRAEQSAVNAEMQARLFDELKNAPTEAAGRIAENAIWESWMAAGPTQGVRDDMKAAMKARESYDYDKALGLLDGIVETAPDYAEGWNQRAFVYFLKDMFDESLADLDIALELAPNHFAALSGKAIVLMRQGRMELAQEALRQAVEIHPWLRERSMIIPLPGEMQIPPGGKDI